MRASPPPPPSSPPRPPYRGVRASQTSETVRVYQAYPHAIADAALAAGKLSPPFRRERMTWIKPSFLWMMYRCGWAQKDDGQRRVLAIDLHVRGFREALQRASLADDQRGRVDVIVQWDPERSLRGGALDHRSLQMGLRGRAVDDYVDRWTAAISDITPLVLQIHAAVRAGEDEAALALLPIETPFLLEPDVAARLESDDDQLER